MKYWLIKFVRRFHVFKRFLFSFEFIYSTYDLVHKFIIQNIINFILLQVMPVYEEVDEVGMSKISKSGIILRAGPEHFVNGHMLIRCQASISLGNHNVFTLPVQHNNTPIQSSSKFGYQKDALISGMYNVLSEYNITLSIILWKTYFLIHIGWIWRGIMHLVLSAKNIQKSKKLFHSSLFGPE